ncbi:aldehyde dehydrogenase family protein [Lacisediminihabitans changchengi]|uniref:Aldehyde dehydrogenase family protein n=1 Tax=Lacisediminihabitans changchengi TaxID=2787634 RepID=A0A934SNS9_9MICO|nr:aldehyde dehydrogenase family protein [Lacisediminihabitans changchengi]MBK4348820.1 aldehyde dehydrogenase family protein [Lacisediminihabitans changchengi]
MIRPLPESTPAAAIAVTRGMAADGLGLFIDGEERPGAERRRFSRIDPYSGESWYDVADASADDVDAAVASAHRAQASVWGSMSAYERSLILLRIADAVEKDADVFGLLDTLDNGKLFRETRSQAVGVAHSLRYAAGGAEKVEGVTAPASDNQTLAMSIRVPYGVIGMIVPWNSPLPLLIDGAAPALAAGNTVVVKTSEDAPASILRFAHLALANGLPPGVLNVVSGTGPQAGEALVRHPGISKIVFTGGSAVGRRVASAAADRLIPVLLELGGKSAQIVMPDADINRVIPGLVSGVFAAAGQSCVAGGRALVQRSIYAEVVERMSEAAESLMLGDPMMVETQMGPLGSRRQTESALRHVHSALDGGARLVSGGQTRSTGLGQGQFFTPAVFADVDPANTLFQEEVFGPVLGLTPFDTLDEAIALANDSRYGLASGIWTTDIDTALRAATRIDAGTVWVNTYRAPEMTLSAGGTKESGYGRIGGSRQLYEFTREKSVIVNFSGVGNDPFVMGGGATATNAPATSTIVEG